MEEHFSIEATISPEERIDYFVAKLTGISRFDAKTAGHPLMSISIRLIFAEVMTPEELPQYGGPLMLFILDDEVSFFRR